MRHNLKNNTILVGFDKNSIIKRLKPLILKFLHVNKKPKGTGDAVKCGIDEVKTLIKVLVLYGDVPLIKKKLKKDLYLRVDESLDYPFNNSLNDPYGYGRVKKDNNGNVTQIIEEKDASTQDEKNYLKFLQGLMLQCKNSARRVIKK